MLIKEWWIPTTVDISINQNKFAKPYLPNKHLINKYAKSPPIHLFPMTFSLDNLRS